MCMRGMRGRGYQELEDTGWIGWDCRVYDGASGVGHGCRVSEFFMFA